MGEGGDAKDFHILCYIITLVIITEEKIHPSFLYFSIHICITKEFFYLSFSIFQFTFEIITEEIFHLNFSIFQFTSAIITEEIFDSELFYFLIHLCNHN